MEILIDFFDRKLNKVKEDKIILRNNILEVPMFIGRQYRRFKLFIDYDKQRVFLTKEFYIDKFKEEEEIYKYI